MKLKDNYDFLYLKNYGFERHYAVDEWCWELEYKKGFYKENIIIWEDNRELQIQAIILLNVLYDMIQDGMIEKVEEE